MRLLTWLQQWPDRGCGSQGDDARAGSLSMDDAVRRTGDGNVVALYKASVVPVSVGFGRTGRQVAAGERSASERSCFQLNSKRIGKRVRRMRNRLEDRLPRLHGFRHPNRFKPET